MVYIRISRPCRDVEEEIPAECTDNKAYVLREDGSDVCAQGVAEWCRWSVYRGMSSRGMPLYIKGNFYARRRIAAIRTILKQFGLDNRVRSEWISASEGDKFARVMTEMAEDLKKLGPNPMRGKIL